MVPQCCLRFVIVVFPDHTHLLFLYNFARGHCAEHFCKIILNSGERLWRRSRLNLFQILTLVVIFWQSRTFCAIVVGALCVAILLSYS